MRFEESKVGNVLVAKVLDGRIAADVAPRFKAHLAEYVSKGNSSIVLDLAAVTFIDSSGLGALVSSLKSISKQGNLVISGAHGSVAGMFKLTRMDKVFRMFGSTDEAVTALSSVTALS
jgi:anti-sigma B factor antagonist